MTLALDAVAPMLRSVFRRAGAKAFEAIEPSSIGQLVHAVEGVLPGNGAELGFEEVQRLLGRASVVDVLGRPAGRQGLHVVVVEDAPGDRMLAMLRQGATRDVAAEQFFTDVAHASGLEDFVAPMALARDGSSALVQIIPHQTLASAGIETAAGVEHALARGHRWEGLSTTAAAHEARVDRELLASLDAIMGNADRHGGNALIDAARGRLTLIDHELVGGGAFHAARRSAGLLDPLLQGGSRVGRSGLMQVMLSEDAVAHLADVEPAALIAAHDRLAASPLPGRAAEWSGWLRSSDYRDRVLANLARAVDEGGWRYG